MEGILNINKPHGITSMAVVRRMKRSSRQKRVGHGGALDPAASGVVPIFFGQATRVMDYVIEGTKAYDSVVELGVTTDTYDSEGQVTDRSDASHITRHDVEQALEPFKGSIKQVPPMYSALKREGKRLYELARAGIEVERKARAVEVFSIDLLDWKPSLATIKVSCGRGFYMRSFAHDLGQNLGCGGHLKSLVRLRSGPFHISDSLSPDDAEQKISDGTWEEALYGPDAALQHLRVVIVGKRHEDLITHGRPLPAGMSVPLSQPSDPDEECRAYTVDGRFLAILSFNSSTGQWQPHRVFLLKYSDGENPL